MMLTANVNPVKDSIISHIYKEYQIIFKEQFSNCNLKYIKNIYVYQDNLLYKSFKCFSNDMWIESYKGLYDNVIDNEQMLLSLVNVTYLSKLRYDLENNNLYIYIK